MRHSKCFFILIEIFWLQCLLLETAVLSELNLSTKSSRHQPQNIYLQEQARTHYSPLVIY